MLGVVGALLVCAVVFHLLSASDGANNDPVSLSSDSDENPSMDDNGPKQSLDAGRIGSFAVATDTLIKLNNTEGKSFKLSGEVWLGGNSTTSRYPKAAPGGFMLMVRQTDGLHSYEFNADGVRDKRRLLEGKAQTKIIAKTPWADVPLHTWIPFTLTVNADKISYQIGSHTAEIAGPLDTNGNNQIDLIAGSKLQNVQLEILGGA